MSAAKTVNDFKQLVQQQTDELVAKCHHWQEILSEKASEIGNNEDVKGQILTTIGQARLLIKERFGQFSGLIDDCEQQRGEKKTTTDDLAGFWDMISMQIDDVNKKFGLLETAQKNKWRLPETTTIGGNRPHMTTTTTGSGSKSRESGGTQNNGNGEQQNAVSFESTDRVKEEAEKSATVRERKNELRNFIAQQKKEKQQQQGGGGGDGELFVDIKAP